MSKNILEDVEENLVIALQALNATEVDYGLNYGIVGGQDGVPRVITIVVMRIRAHALGEYHSDGWFMDSPAPEYPALLEGASLSVQRLLEKKDLEAKAVTETSQMSPGFPGVQGHGHDRLHQQMPVLDPSSIIQRP